MSTSERVPRREILLLVAVLVLALLLRLPGLDGSLWYDEVFSLGHFIRLPPAKLVTAFWSFNNHMLYSLEAKAMVALFGETAWALRLPALVFGVASIAVVWRLGRTAGDTAAPLLAALLLALSYHHVWFSQNARGYTELLFWTSLATLLLERVLQRPAWGLALGYGFCFAAAMYTHLSAALFFVAHALVYVLVALAWSYLPGWQARYPGWRDRRVLAGFGVGMLLTAALHAPLVDDAMRTLRKVSGSSGIPSMAEWESPLRMGTEILKTLGGLGPLAPLAIVAGLALALAGGIVLYRRAPLLVTIYAVQMPLSLAILWALAMRIWPRYFFVDVGFVLLCVAAGAVAFATALGRRITLATQHRGLARAPLVVMVLAMTLASAAALARNYAHPKQDFLGAVALVQRERGAGDIAGSVGLAAEALRHYYAPDWPVIGSAAELDALLATTPRVWLVTAFQPHTDAHFPDVMGTVQRRFDLVAALPGTLGNGTVRVYRSR